MAVIGCKFMNELNEQLDRNGKGTEMTKYVTGQIYGWNGGECPVHPKTVVQVWLRMGTTSDRRCANAFSWAHHKATGDIVCF